MAAAVLHGLVRDGARSRAAARAQPVASFAEAQAWLLEEAKKGRTIQRFKGLGEMNPEQLWETTVNPETRRLLQVRIEDAVAADQIFAHADGRRGRTAPRVHRGQRAEGRQPRRLTARRPWPPRRATRLPRRRARPRGLCPGAASCSTALLGAALLIGLSTLLIMPVVVLHIAGPRRGWRRRRPMPDCAAHARHHRGRHRSPCCSPPPLTWWLRGRRLRPAAGRMAATPAFAWPSSAGICIQVRRTGLRLAAGAIRRRRRSPATPSRSRRCCGAAPWLAWLLIVVVGPFAEELLLRHVLLRRFALRRATAPPASCSRRWRSRCCTSRCRRRPASPPGWAGWPCTPAWAPPSPRSTCAPGAAARLPGARRLQRRGPAAGGVFGLLTPGLHCDARRPGSGAAATATPPGRP